MNERVQRDTPINIAGYRLFLVHAHAHAIPKSIIKCAILLYHTFFECFGSLWKVTRSG